MNTKQATLSKSSLFLLAASSILLTGLPAQAINLTFSPSDFTITPEGVGSNSSSPDIEINKKALPEGFGDGTNGFFTSNFLLLGADPSDDSILTGSEENNPKTKNNTTADSKPFKLTEGDRSGGLNFSFNWAFQGNNTGGEGEQDNFNIFLIKEDFSVYEPIFAKTLPGGYGNQIGETVEVTGDKFTSGNYKLRIILNENDHPHNSAAGYNDFTVNTVPFEFSPTTGLLIVGGFLGFTYLKKRKQVFLSTNFDQDDNGENQS